MTDDDPAPVVEFVGGDPQTGTDELLPVPPRRSPSQRLQLAVGAAVLIGVAVVARAISHDGAAKPAVTHAAPLPQRTVVAVSPTPGAPYPTRAPRPAAGRLGQVYGAHGPGWCPPADDGMPTCIGIASVPRTVLDAVRERFPRVGHLVVLDEQLRDIGFGPGGLWYREVDARLGRRSVIVAVHRQTGQAPPRVARFRSAHRTTLVVERATGRFVVRVQVSAPNGRRTSPVPVHDLLAFASDERLRSPG